MPTTRAYVDGFNLYRSLLIKHPSAKWLDFTALWAAWFRDFTVERTYYFTAKVHSLPLDKGAPARQQAYLDALGEQVPDVQVVLGDFREDKVMARPTAWSVRDRLEVWQNNEKGSDVNLASYLLRDVYKGEIDRAIVVTNDSDLVRPIEFAIAEGVQVFVCTPGREANNELTQTGAQMFTVSEARLISAQLPDPMPSTRRRPIRRPYEWR